MFGVLALVIDAGVLAALIGSINIGLFGFTESLNAPFVMESILIETLTALALASWITVDRMAQNQHRIIKLPTPAEHLQRSDRPAPTRTATSWNDPGRPPHSRPASFPMFFGDPRAACSNIARSLRAGGRLALLVWQGREPNEWIREFSRPDAHRTLTGVPPR
jgi:hypothetical protein